MDPAEDSNVSDGTKRRRGALYNLLILLRSLLILLSTLFVVFFVLFLSFFAVFDILFVKSFSISNPISVAADCKIVSTSVDLRSSKVCELGLFNYKAKHVFYPLERKRFRCRYDYYWASIFTVEYTEHSSGQTRQALAETPKEALPIDCRPSFDTAWLTKDKFKVNETYECWYTPGISKVNIYSDSLFNCQAEDPSVVEMIRRYSILTTRIINTYFSNEGRSKHAMWDTIAGTITGMLTSLVCISLIKLVKSSKSRLAKMWEARKVHIAVYGVCYKRVCFLVAYFSIMGWLTIQYGKMLGLPKIFVNL